MIYSQNDKAWRDIKLGRSSVSIGNFGCVITSLSNLMAYYGEKHNPLVVNSKLKTVNGFLKGNLLIWAKIKEAFPNFEWKWRGYKYENGVVDENLPCLVEVKAPSPYMKHWVLKIDKERVYDPYRGTDEPFSKYTPTGYSIIKYLKPKPTPKEKSDLEKCLRQSELLITELHQLKKNYAKSEEENQKYKEDQDKLRKCIKGLTGEIGELQGTIKVHEKNKEEYKTFVEKLQVMFNCSEEALIPNMKKLLASESNYQKTIKDLKDEYDSYKSNKETEIGQLRGEIEQLKRHASNLEVRLDQLEDKDKTNESIFDIIKKLFRKEK